VTLNYKLLSKAHWDGVPSWLQFIKEQDVDYSATKHVSSENYWSTPASS